MIADLPPLPEPPAALRNDDSMLTRRFGREAINYYAGGHLNRFSILRADAGFLARAATSPAARYLVLHQLSPLTVDKSRLALLPFDDVKPLLGADPFRLSEDEAVREFDSTAETPLLVFLGVDEGSQAAAKFSSDHGPIRGEPFFALDATPRGPYAEAAAALVQKLEGQGLVLQKDARAMTLHADQAAMYAQARSIVDWNTRSPFCAGCGHRTLAVHAGWKRVCPPADRSGTGVAHPRADCATRHGVSNICFPRTDPTMIAAVVSADGRRVLLGRQARWPPHWHSCLAGFLEPGESVEEAVRREVWEEAGVRVGRVVVHSTQPWPYPSCLMVGAIAQALPGDGEEIHLNDHELEVARWFGMDEIKEALKHGIGSLSGETPPGYEDGNLRLPPPQAIANRLITAVADGFVAGPPRM